MNTLTVLAQAPTDAGIEPQSASSVYEVLSFVLWGCTFFGVLALMIGGAMIARSRMLGIAASYSRSGEYTGSVSDNAVQMLVGGFVVAVIPFPLRVLMLGSGSAESPAPETTNTEPPSIPIPEPPAEAASPAPPFDWTPVIYLAVVVAALAVVALAVYLVVRTRHRILDRAAAAATLAADFAAARAIYAEVAGAYAEYLADPYAIFTRPLLDDLGDPRTAAFIDAFAEAGALNTETCPDSKKRVQAFADAARTALAAWKDADGHARAIGLGVRTDADKRTVRRIRSALDLALDDSAAAGEREAAMATVERLSDGLMTVPDRIYARAKTALETTTRKQLTR